MALYSKQMRKLNSGITRIADVMPVSQYSLGRKVRLKGHSEGCAPGLIIAYNSILKTIRVRFDDQIVLLHQEDCVVIG